MFCPPPIPIPRQTTFSNIFVRRFCRWVLRSDCARHFQIFRATVALIFFFFCRLFASSNVNICVHLSWKLLLTPLFDWNFARTWTNMRNFLGYASSAFAFSLYLWVLSSTPCLPMKPLFAFYARVRHLWYYLNSIVDVFSSCLCCFS